MIPTILILSVLATAALTCWCCLVMAGRADEAMERAMEDVR